MVFSVVLAQAKYRLQQSYARKDPVYATDGGRDLPKFRWLSVHI
jgi:hypothetical protein